MKRRIFNKQVIKATAFTAISPSLYSFTNKSSYVHLGGPVFEKIDSPKSWIAALQRQHYRAAYCPLQPGAASDEIKAYEQAAKKADIVISEVGVWINLISPDTNLKSEAIEKTKKALQLADAIGANCCVNVSGSKNPEQWAGPHKDNLSQETFDEIVQTAREIIDDVAPTRTYFALEPMPWAYPDSADNYVRLIKAIDRRQFGVHLDPMNLIVSPQLFYNSGAMIKECFSKLGPHIRSCHGKDIVLREDIYTPQLTECRPGLGFMDYGVFLKELSKLKDIPLMMEHLATQEEYSLAAKYIRSVGKEEGIEL